MILSVKTIGKCGAACLLELKSCVVLMRKLALFVGNSCMICHATKTFGIQPSCKLSLFFMKMSELAGYF